MYFIWNSKKRPHNAKKYAFLLFSPDYASLRQLKKLNYIKTDIGATSVTDIAGSLVPFARMLHIRIMLDWMDQHTPNSSFASLPGDLRGVCLLYGSVENASRLRFDYTHLPQDLRILCIHVDSPSFRDNHKHSSTITAFFTNVYAYLPKLQKLTITYGATECTRRYLPCSMDGKLILRYLQSAEHLIELRLCSWRFNNIEVNDFYDRALQIIEKRETKLPLKIYYRGKTIVRKNNLLKLFNATYKEFCSCRHGYN